MPHLFKLLRSFVGLVGVGVEIEREAIGVEVGEQGLQQDHHCMPVEVPGDVTQPDLAALNAQGHHSRAGAYAQMLLAEVGHSLRIGGKGQDSGGRKNKLGVGFVSPLPVVGWVQFQGSFFQAQALLRLQHVCQGIR